MPSSFRHMLLASATIMLPSVTATATAAQTADTAAPPIAISSPAIEEVIVTASRRAEDIQQVPVAVTAVSSQELQDRGVTDASDLQFIVPNMQVGDLIGNTGVTIRGVGLNQGAPGVAIHVDGVYQAHASMGNLAQTDLERVEVLRGPQGTLYGRNANGGVINFITKAPTDQFEGYVQGSVASYSEYRLQGVINVPISDHVRSRLVVDYWDREDGFVKNVIPGGQDVDKGRAISGRLRVAADLTSNLELDLTASGAHRTGPTFYFTLYNKPTADAVSKNPWLVNAVVPLEPRRISANDPIASNVNFGQFDATLTWNLEDWQLKSISSFTRFDDRYLRDDDAINVSGFPARSRDGSSTFIQEFDASGTVGPVDAVAGVFFMRDNYDTHLHYDFPLGIFPLPPGSQLDWNNPRYLTTSYAFFTDLTWHVTDQLRLIGGVRYSKDNQKSTQYNWLSFGPSVQMDTCPLQTNEVNSSSTTPRFGAQYDVSDNSHIYATYSKGFKVGGYNPYSCANLYLPEKLTAYEVGIKNRLFDNTVMLNLSGFYYDYTDLQLNQVVGLASLITNAAAAKVKGVEIEAAWQPDAHWSFNANLSILDAKYSSFINTDSLAPALGPQDVSGNYLNNAPGESANISAAYHTDPFSFGMLTARVDVSQRTKTYFREFNTPLDSQKGYTLLNLTLIWDSPDGKYRARLFGTNLTNADYVVRMSSSDNFGSRFVTWGAPRQYGIELTANF